ncbi:hypothetical protein BP6252_03127 [Coleophoma cylindrospora]|uniref:Putative transcription factor kapC n=1 Tax=Coleophoma cylindrospora TaxID=1849047 RepID=A0A3D8S6T3_9HELO|nr:hypothetical protein BP6252_03127 [Coleophoma cylindrospora]
MSVAPYHDSGEPHSYFPHTEGTPGLYDGTSSDSSASSPLNTQHFESVYANGFASYSQYSPFPYQFPAEGYAPPGLIPVELDIEGLYEDHDRRRRKNPNGTEKVVASHVHSRRRAQNRASQRAFRDRKEKHMRELEQKLGELEGRHNDLTRSYESLQVEYSSVKAELDRLRKDSSKTDSSSPQSYIPTSDPTWDHSKDESLDPLLFDVSAFCYDHEDDQNHS